MAVIDSDNLKERVKSLLPRRWWAWVAPMRDAIIGGTSDLAEWSYGLILYARSQTRLATANGIVLDILCYDFLRRNLKRDSLTDVEFRALIKATIFTERVTRNGMSAAVQTLTGKAPWIFEPWNTGDTGAYSNASQTYGQFGYGVGIGGYGNMELPGQVFMKVTRSAGSGVPAVTGYSGYAGGFGQGSIEYVDSDTALAGITNQQIENLIVHTKPTGVTVWMQF
jgi:hypothetical protein